MAATIDFAKHFALFLILLSVLFQICNGFDHKNVLFTGDDRLRKRESLYNGNYSLEFHDDCRLALYDHRKLIWASSNTADYGRCVCDINSHGEFSIFTTKPVWFSEWRSRHPNGQYVLILQNDRNLVIHGPHLWCEPNCYYNPPSDGIGNVLTDPLQKKMITDADVGCEVDKGVVLYTSQSLEGGECLRYAEFTLIMQKDCNLVLYEYDKVKWATNTTGKSQLCYLHMPYDGNLAVRGYDLRVLWSAFPKSKDDGSYVLVLRAQGKIIMYGSSIWSLGTNKANEMPAINDKSSTAEAISATNGVAAVL